MSENNVDSSSANSDVKSEISNTKSDVESDSKIKKERKMPSTISEASSLDLDDVSQDEKVNFSVKRNREIPPLLVSNLPERFSLLQVTDYLVKLCGSCEVSFIKNGDSKAVEATFENTSQRLEAKKILSSQTIDNVRIRAESPILQDYDSDEESEHGPRAKRKKESDEAPWGIDMDLWRTDPRGWYGVKPQYLASLGIEGPLHNWVLVKNFRSANEELREVMSLAGDVQVCSVSYSTPKRFARVMYRHPLEALQAVSMLDGQIYYGCPLSVKIIKASGSILPKGLHNIGPGLAKYGGPLKDVMRHYKRFLKGQDNDINNIFFRTPQEQSTDDNDSYNDHIVKNANREKAREALKTLIALIGQGMKVNDIVTELKSIKTDEKDSIDQILKELDEVTKTDAKSNIKSNNVCKNQNRDTQPSPISSESSSHSGPPSPESISKATKKNVTVSHRPKESPRLPSVLGIPTIVPTNPRMPQPIAPGTGPGYGHRHIGPGPIPIIRPIERSGPVFGSGMPVTPVAPRPLPGPMSRPMAVSGPAGPMSVPLIAPNFSMPGPNTHPPFGPNVHKKENEATLQFSNLPLTTTFALLSDKLSQVGQLASIQFTTPGCVLVTFAHKAFAEKCRQQFDQSRLDGNLIDVRFV